MEHTFLFQEGRWVANGNYTDAKNDRRPATGSTEVTHTEHGWINAGSMMMLAGTGLVTFENRGFVLQGGRKIGAWELELQKE